MWQDIALMIIGFLFTVMLLPQLYDAYLGRAKLNKWTCVVTGFGCITIGGIDVTLNLPLAAVVSVSTGMVWLALMYYSEKNRKTDTKLVESTRIICHSPPGDTIVDRMLELGLTFEEFSRRMARSEFEMLYLIKGDTPIDGELAGLLEKVIGGTKEFWTNRERIYREDQKR